MPHVCSIDAFLKAPGVILDVRSPGEYEQGHIPGAKRFPLFTDEERAQVGTCYKQQGRDAAVELGLAIAGPKLAQFVARAKELAPDRRVRIHCWRGGMRSGSVAWLLETAGFRVATLEGGYKTFRRWVLAAFEVRKPIITLGGMTGTGKTNILQAIAARGAQVLDLEALASHRGSSYGGLELPPQPSNEQFENRVAIAWSAFDPRHPVWIEAESRRVGICRVPDALFQQMMKAPILQVVRSRAERLSLLVEIYGTADMEALVVATERIRKRLGGLRTQQAVDFIRQGKLAEAADIVLDYYDKTYQYDLEKRHAPLYTVEVSGLSDVESAELLLEKAHHCYADFC